MQSPVNINQGLKEDTIVNLRHFQTHLSRTSPDHHKTIVKIKAAG